MNKLEPCPLCGSDGRIKDVQGKFRHGWVGCPKCGLYIDWTYRPEETIEIWNRRANNG